MTRSQESGQQLVVHAHDDTRSLDKLDEILLTGELNVEIVDDPNEISRQIVAQLLNAADDEELQNFGNATGWRELQDIPVELHGFRWQASSFEGEGAPVYFIVSATRLDTGERVTLTTGSMNVLAQLSNMARRGTLVGSVWMLHQADNPTRQGYRPLWLVQPDEVKRANRERAAAATEAAAG
jgi:hypothetical protein